ncbi:MAG: hypothetical protein OEW87_10890 [Flavobacteriaceae bacterium]|nr:hypothetical protein [Flavobacteriaceae bacterium]
MSKSTIWIHYDFGVLGDYESFYQWLDKQEAKECGDGLALLKYEYSGNLIESLKSELDGSIIVTKKTRMYVIYRDQQSQKMKGVFIFGGRKTPVWSGFFRKNEEDLIDYE